MKKSFLVLVVLLTVGSVYARGYEGPTSAGKVGVMKKGSVFHVFYKAAQAADVTVSIFDDNDKLVYSEVIRKVDGFTRPYNFSKLPEGQYTISVGNGSSVNTEKVTYGETKAVAAVKKSLAHVVKVADGQDRYLLTVPKNGQQEISVKIFTEDGTLLHQEKENVSGDFARVYNLKSVKGKFSFEVSDEEGNVRTIRY